MYNPTMSKNRVIGVNVGGVAHGVQCTVRRLSMSRRFGDQDALRDKLSGHPDNGGVMKDVTPLASRGLNNLAAFGRVSLAEDKLLAESLFTKMTHFVRVSGCPGGFACRDGSYGVGLEMKGPATGQASSTDLSAGKSDADSTNTDWDGINILRGRDSNDTEVTDVELPTPHQSTSGIESMLRATCPCVFLHARFMLAAAVVSVVFLTVVSVSYGHDDTLSAARIFEYIVPFRIWILSPDEKTALQEFSTFWSFIYTFHSLAYAVSIGRICLPRFKELMAEFYGIRSEGNLLMLRLLWVGVIIISLGLASYYVIFWEISLWAKKQKIDKQRKAEQHKLPASGTIESPRQAEREENHE